MDKIKNYRKCYKVYVEDFSYFIDIFDKTDEYSHFEDYFEESYLFIFIYEHYWTYSTPLHTTKHEKESIDFKNILRIEKFKNIC